MIMKKLYLKLSGCLLAFSCHEKGKDVQHTDAHPSSSMLLSGARFIHDK